MLKFTDFLNKGPIYIDPRSIREISTLEAFSCQTTGQECGARTRIITEHGSTYIVAESVESVRSALEPKQ